MSLILPEQTLLIALDDEKGRDTTHWESDLGLAGALLANREPTEEEALLIGLLEPLGLIDSVVPKDRRRDARKRAKPVAEQGLTDSAVGDAIRAVQAAVIAAIAASTVVSAN